MSVAVFGSLLLLLYINDTFDYIDASLTFCHLYADDTIIIQSANDALSLKNGLESQLNDLSKWFFNNKLTVNTDKTEDIVFGREDKVNECKNMPTSSFENCEINLKTDVKYLGVVFDEGLTWEAYLGLNKIRRISSMIDMIQNVC